jgi:Asp-tRNA(Asn)/Glu-tRNA(Gln) amidotransferase A subunit family amidase
LADVALGTDTGGSVRIPAACTGLIGFKPTLDAISTAGTWPLSQTLDHVGVIGRHLRDVERTAGILLDLPQAEPDDERSIRRIGVDWTLLQLCDAEVRATFEQVTTHCRSAGFEIVPITLPGPDAALKAHRTVLLADATNVYRSYVIDRLADLAQRSLALAAKIADDEIDDARAAIAATRTAVETLFNQVDLILTPTLRCPVPAKGARQIDIQGKPTSVTAALISFTAPFNASGHPALALPTTTTLHGIPFSVQLVGPLGVDRWLLRSVRGLAHLALNPHLDE